MKKPQITDYAQARKILKTYDRKIFKIKNVNYTSIRLEDGHWRLKIGVSKQLPEHKKLCNPNINIKGLPVDVEEIGEIRAHSRKIYVRPAPPGVEIGNINSPTSAGTFGCTCTKAGTKYILSNNHVIARKNSAELGEVIVQDAGSDPDDRIGTLTEFITIVWDDAENPNTVDAAICDIDDDADVLDKLLDFQHPRGSKAATVGMIVGKSGRTTGVTLHELTEFSGLVYINYGDGLYAYFDDLLISDPKMSDPGDSGSVWLDVNDNQAVGLGFAGSADRTLACRMTEVVSALGISIYDYDPGYAVGTTQLADVDRVEGDYEVTLNGYVVEIPGSNPTRYFEWGTAPETYPNTLNKGTGTVGAFTHVLEGLSPGTYYYRTKLVDGVNTDYGHEVKFIVPKIITTLVQLQAMNDQKTWHYVLDNDIDASETSTWNWNETREVYEGFLGIGGSSSAEYFAGSFDGQGYTISNLYIDVGVVWADESSRIGLFRAIKSAPDHLDSPQYNEVKNLKLVDVDITGWRYVAALIGYCAAFVYDCSSTGSVTGGTSVDYSYAAGLVAHSRYWLERCYSEASVSSSLQRTGGLAGYSGGVVRDCYARGSVSGSKYVGGLCGEIAEAFGGYGEIRDCYSTGAISGTSGVGGLIGNHYGAEVSIVSSYWDTETSGIETSDGGTGKTTAQMKQEATFVDWDFADVWEIDEGVSYPTLRVTTEFDVLIDAPIISIGSIALSPAIILLCVSTSAVTDIHATYATGHGAIEITSENCDTIGICWNVTGSPTREDNKNESAGSFPVCTFSFDLTELYPLETYYVRAYAHNSAGYVYGNQVQFDTPILSTYIDAPLTSVSSVSNVPAMSLGFGVTPALITISAESFVVTTILDRVSTVPLTEATVAAPTPITGIAALVLATTATISGESKIPTIFRDRVITAPLITISSTAPIAWLGDVSVYPPLVAASSVAFAVTLTGIHVTILPPVVTIQSGSVQFLPPVIAATSTALEPSTASDITISSPLISMGSISLAPLLFTDIILDATLATIDSTHLDPAFILSHTMSPPLVAIDSQGIVPGFVRDITFVVPRALIASSARKPFAIWTSSVVIFAPVATIDGMAWVPLVYEDPHRVLTDFTNLRIMNPPAELRSWIRHTDTRS